MTPRHERVYQRTGRVPRPHVQPIGMSLGNTSRLDRSQTNSARHPVIINLVLALKWLKKAFVI